MEAFSNWGHIVRPHNMGIPKKGLVIFMSKLVIVESPSKAKTIQKYLGDGYEVMASMGHVRDLPKARLSVDVKDHFKPKYSIIKGKEKLVKELKEAAANSDGVLLATDPDREGEAISWHLAYILGLDENSQDVHLLHMYWYDAQTQSAQRLPISPQNVHFMFPKFNDSWLVYLDANLDGGGAIMAVDLTADTMTPVKVKDIYVGQPEPMLDGNYVAFMDRTGTKKEKLFVFDLTTMESTVVEMFSGTVYGQSKPSLQDGRLLWAEPSSTQGDSDLSCIRYMQLGEVAPQSGIGGNGIYTPGTFVHDPKHSGKYTAWLSDVHSSGTQLYGVVDLMGDPFLIDSGVVDFGIGTDFVAYSRTDASVSPATEAIFLYMFETNSIYRLTQDYESAQLLGVSGEYVIWMDVTSRERDIVKYVKIP